MSMEKLGVEIDPKKKADYDKKQGGEKTASDGQARNVPWDPNKGTEPFEKAPTKKKEG